MPGPLHPRESLSGYVDDHLASRRRVVVERHLSRCTRCALEVAQIRSLRRLMSERGVPEAPPELRERLLSLGRDQRDEARPPPPERPAARPLAGATAVMVAGVLVLGAAGVGAVVTGATTPWPGDSARASLSTVLPRLLQWPDDPDGAITVRPVDNGDRP